MLYCKKFLLKFTSLIYYCCYLIWFFLARLRSSYKAKIPVISVGNISYGGTGKTPFVSWLVGFLQTQGFKPVVFTRGYKSQGKKMRLLIQAEKQPNKILPMVGFYGDEPVMLSLHHPKVPIVIFPKRKKSLMQYSHLGNIGILDDGMQHLAVARDIDICLVNSLVGFGNKKLLPQGILREPLSALKRNDLILLTGCNLEKDSQYNANKIRQIQQDLPQGKNFFSLELKAKYLIDSKNLQKIPLKKLENKEVVVFCAIANPQGFVLLLKSILGTKGKIVKTFYFPDHFSYSKTSLEKVFCYQKKISKKYSKISANSLFLTTEKDWVKLFSYRKEMPKFFVVKTEIKVPATLQIEFKKRLKNLNRKI